MYLAVNVLGALVHKGTASTLVLRWFGTLHAAACRGAALRDALKTRKPDVLQDALNPVEPLSLRDAH